MPAICRNVANWHNDPAKSNWPTRWNGWFTYDLGSSGSTITSRGQVRRNRICPPTWKGTLLNPRCPQQGQPRVVPPLWDEFTGLPVTGLAPQLDPNDVHLVIADGRDNPLYGVNQPSGRIYSCDEFPPASWIEGGVGFNGQTPGTTYCAPIAMRCDGEHDARGSEQNWQGFVHGYLGAELEVQARTSYPQNGQVSVHPPVAFQFVATPDAQDTWAARVVWDGVGRRNWQAVTPGTPFVRRDDDEEVERHASHFVPTGNGSMAIVLPNGEVFHTHERRAVQRAVKRSTELRWEELRKRSPSTEFGQVSVEVSNSTDVPEWYVAQSLDEIPLTYSLCAGP
jgi:chitinase